MKYVEFRDWIFVAKLFGILNITLFLFISFKKKCLLALFHKWVLKFWGKISWLIDLKNSMISNTLPFHDFLVTDNLKTIKGQCVTLFLRFFIFLFKKHKWNSCSSSTVTINSNPWTRGQKYSNDHKWKMNYVSRGCTK